MKKNNQSKIYIDQHKKIHFQGREKLDNPLPQKIVRVITSKKFLFSCLIAGIATGIIIYFIR